MKAKLKVPHPTTGTPAFVDQETAAQYTGRCQRTVQRWIQAGRIEDTAALRLLQMHAHGLLAHSGAWAGWCIAGERLVSPDNSVVMTPQELAAAWLHIGLIRELRQRCQALEEALGDVRKNAKRPLVSLVWGGK